jgi:phosphoribosylaminoimidazole-succinocarboxamide synthase
MMPLLLQSELPGLNLVNRGKVRDIYDLGETLLIVTTDRISAFDVVMNEGIPYKGFVLTQISRFWFEHMADIIPNHLLATEADDFPAVLQPYREQLAGRSMVVRKARPLPIECIVRGYLAGSGWKEYRAQGTVCGIPLPADLRDGDRLPEAIFTPSTKAELGAHDENISFAQAVELCGEEVAGQARDAALKIYDLGRRELEAKGILLADTKFEFGLVDGQLIWIDEALTPDSSRFWPRDQYCPGAAQPSFDKQFLRDYLETLDWNKQPPAPRLPEEIVRKTSEKYLEALKRITGREV